MPLHDVQDPRERLIAGVLRFQQKVYPKQKLRYEELMREGQKPHTLFITCADSRIDPELITQSGPGEIFVCRNIGNLVPAYGEVLGGVSAIVEYALVALQVCHVVVCGHTDCGAMIGLLHPEKVTGMPTVSTWLRHGEAALSTVRARRMPDDDDTLDRLTEEIVLLQLNHLRTHPSVAKSLAAGGLTLSGWVFDIGRGTVRIYDEDQQKYLPIGKRTITAGATG
jgi:carbonic anhydrase